MLSCIIKIQYSCDVIDNRIRLVIYIQIVMNEKNYIRCRSEYIKMIISCKLIKNDGIYYL
jgi:hypothetical protein